MMGETQMDLFADRMNAQKIRYMSWKPDPGAETVDAFSVSWTDLKAYAFPPICLIGRCLAKAQKDQATILLITPVWTAQPWFPTVLEMSMELPVLLPQHPKGLTSPQGEPHPMWKTGSLQLAAWKISWVEWRRNIFLTNLPHYSCKHGDQVLSQLTRGPGTNGLAGVVRNKLIHFRPLWS